MGGHSCYIEVVVPLSCEWPRDAPLNDNNVTFYFGEDRLCIPMATDEIQDLKILLIYNCSIEWIL